MFYIINIMMWAENSVYKSFQWELFCFCYSHIWEMGDTGQFNNMREHFVQLSGIERLHSPNICPIDAGSPLKLIKTDWLWK